eukprot:CAMPEP_0171742636 /NCGR_PEP_ID=MMETSP0991-20121206/36361_1 /TAXON_ID=483369 /ORGANISM="non described non described, Strain CCMP2098" /LENGTH=555 /DNA_ID=CAMNT_0012341311 /DNA_START=100 /DNA_END=1767 /DNA_ORIENTATION=+
MAGKIPFWATDRKNILSVLSKDGHKLRELPEEFYNDVEIVTAAVTDVGSVLQQATDGIKMNCEVVAAAFKSDERSFEYASESLKNSQTFVTSLIALENQTRSFGACALQNASPGIQADPTVVLASVTQRGTSLAYAATELKNDPTIASAAIKQNAKAFEFVSASLRSDPDIIRAVLESMGLTFDFSSIISSGKSPMGDRDLMLMLAPLGSHALKFASVEIKNDREVVLAAVRADCRALSFASREMRNDPEIVLAATAGDCNGMMSLWASDELLSNRDFALQVVSQSDRNRSGLHLENFSQAVCSDPQVAVAAVQNGGYVSHCSIGPWRTAEERELYWFLFKTAVSRNGDMLSQGFIVTRENKDVVMLAVTKGVRLCGHHSADTRGTRALSYASQELQADPEIVLAAVELNGEALEYASTNLRADFDVVATAVAQNADALVWASQDLKSGLYTQIKEKLNPHRCFVVVLLGMTSFALVSEENLEGSDEFGPKTKSVVFRAETAAPLTGCCFLQMLGNFDPETGTSIKKQIAGFIGIPQGAFLKKLRAAEANLKSKK